MTKSSVNKTMSLQNRRNRYNKEVLIKRTLGLSNKTQLIRVMMMTVLLVETFINYPPEKDYHSYSHFKRVTSGCPVIYVLVLLIMTIATTK